MSKKLRFFLVTVVISTLISCQVRTWRSIETENGGVPIILFERYKVNVSGLASTPRRIFFSVTFLNKVSGPLKLDTIPIFVIDTVCFAGDCLDNQLCYDAKEHLVAKKSPNPSFVIKEKAADDLISERGVLDPEDISIAGVPILPLTCRDHDVFLTFTARIIDRISGATISSESKQVGLLIKDEHFTIRAAD